MGLGRNLFRHITRVSWRWMPAEPGVVFGCHCRKSRTSALLFPMQRYTVPVTVTVVVPGVTV